MSKHSAHARGDSLRPIIIMKMQEYGVEPSPAQAEHREKFKSAAAQTKKHFEEDPKLQKLKGANRVRAQNAYMGELLKS